MGGPIEESVRQIFREIRDAIANISIDPPVGGATEAEQQTQTTHLSTIAGDTTSIDTKTPALGQALSAASVPVVLPAAQITTLTPPAAITGFATSAKQDTIIGHVDGIETAIGTTNSTLTTIDGRVDGLETAVASTNTKLDTVNTNLGTIDGRVDGLEALATTTNRYIAGPGGATAVDSYTTAAINLAAGANQSIISAPGANKQIWVYGISFVLNVAGTVSIQDEDDTAKTGVMPFAANSGLAIPPSGNFAMPLFKVATNKALEMDIVTAEVDGIITYAIMSV